MADEPDELSPAEVDTKLILRIAAAVLFLIAAGIGVSVGLYAWMAPARTFVEPARFPAPNVLDEHNQESPGERNPLVPASETRGAIPIEQAMEMIVGRGADGYAPLQAKQEQAQPASEQGASKPVAGTRGHGSHRRHRRGRSRRG